MIDAASDEIVNILPAIKDQLFVVQTRRSSSSFDFSKVPNTRTVSQWATLPRNLEYTPHSRRAAVSALQPTTAPENELSAAMSHFGLFKYSSTNPPLSVRPSTLSFSSVYFRQLNIRLRPRELTRYSQVKALLTLKVDAMSLEFPWSELKAETLRRACHDLGASARKTGSRELAIEFLRKVETKGRALLLPLIYLLTTLPAPYSPD